jgi:nicotinamidase-related amidase
MIYRVPDVPDPQAFQDTAEIYTRSGIGNRVGFGSRPGIVVVDLQNGFTDASCPVGGDLDHVVAATQRALAAARAGGLPVAFTVIAFQEGTLDAEPWLRKMPGLRELVEGTKWCDVDARLEQRPDELVVHKRAASGFFGTHLASFLASSGVDTLIVTGCVTSGCVRATVIDAVSHGYRVIVPRECVGDRAEGPHEWNLFDIDAKYADVEPLDRVLERLGTAVEVAG